MNKVSLVLSVAAVLMSSRDCAAQAQEAKPAAPPLSVSIAVPMDARGDRSIPLHWSDPHFNVVITNTSDRLQRVWAEDCALGYGDLTLEVVAVDGKALPKPIVVSRPNYLIWSGSFGRGVVLAPGDTMVREVRLPKNKSDAKQTTLGVTGKATAGMSRVNGFDYQNFPSASTVRMRAVFRSGDIDLFRGQGVWTGTVTSDTGNYQVVYGYP